MSQRMRSYKASPRAGATRRSTRIVEDDGNNTQAVIALAGLLADAFGLSVAILTLVSGLVVAGVMKETLPAKQGG